MSTVEVVGTRPAVAAAVDLRTHSRDDVLQRVEHALDVRLNHASEVRKRRSIGAATDRGTWVRIEARRLDKMAGQDFNGPEAAGLVTGIAKPMWHAAITWAEPQNGLMWRADETELVTAAPIKPGGILTVDPQLQDAWWATLDASLNALAAAETTRVATLHTEPISQTRVDEEIHAVFGPGIDTTIAQWTPAHADFSWANLTGPACWILDWEDWGLAPRGLDAAMLWAASLAVPGLAEQVRDLRKADLDSRDGQLMMLFFAAGIVGAPSDYAGPLLEPARAIADKLLTDLQS
ncbi:hypothetical protein QRX50_31755 [Amycolatopsis carbonis]|uniref:Aminoglycoside phosphotransferase n=1 Tax=Amycolatopsis carbonis TaxID=715471 RepID=A0A9Y2IBF6_9PSEU|nr:hypothetical protein [Amycolatopsis sp. 2-15]WIX76035.1 hypothetical protein QRX50_31755 [Amycolatopsis sp. 2-15]